MITGLLHFARKQLFSGGVGRPAAGVRRTKVFLDCDPGHDDFIALVMAANSEHLELIGVSTVHGNSSLRDVTANCRGILRLMRRSDVPVFEGAEFPLARREVPAPHDQFHGPGGLYGVALPAERASEPFYAGAEVYARIAQLVRSQGEPIDFLSTGPLTNLAALLREHPEVAAHIRQVVFMGGAVGLGNVTPAAEFNVLQDPEAGEFLCQQAPRVRTVMSPIDLAEQIAFDRRLIDRVRAQCAPCDFRTQICNSLEYLLAKMVSLNGVESCEIYDPTVVYYAAHAQRCTTLFCNVQVETQSRYSDGRTLVDKFHCSDRPANIHVLNALPNDDFLEAIFQSIRDCCTACASP